MARADDPPGRRTRKLRDEEIALWVEVARSVRARRGATLPHHDAAPTPPPAKPARAVVHPAPTPVVARSGPPPLAPIERRLKRDLQRGAAQADGVIDLHGMTQAQAHVALRGFLARAQGQGAKLVIVITGKGWSQEADARARWFEGAGVLRRNVPHWLREPEMRSVVLGFEEAGPAHGGAGALYVRLRRRRGA